MVFPASLVLAIGLSTSCGCNSGPDAGRPIAISSELSPVATTSFNTISWIASLEKDEVVISYAFAGEDAVRVVKTRNSHVRQLDGSGLLIDERPARSLTGVFPVGVPYSRLYGAVIDAARRGHNQGIDLMVLLEDVAIPLVSCSQAPNWAVGSATNTTFWLALSPAHFCGISCPSIAAFMQFDYDGGAVGSPTCVSTPYGANVSLHPVAPLAILANRQVVAFGDAGVDLLFDDDGGSRKAVFYPLRRIRIHREHLDGGADDLVWIDGGFVVSEPWIPPSPFPMVALNSFDGLTFDAIQPSLSGQYDYVLIRGDESGVHLRTLHVPVDTSFAKRIAYHEGVSTWFLMSERDDAGIRTLFGQHLR
jgi:hypothetical protein